MWGREIEFFAKRQVQFSALEEENYALRNVKAGKTNSKEWNLSGINLSGNVGIDGETSVKVR